MNYRMMLSVVAVLCLATILCLSLFTEDAFAQSADQRTAQRDGLGNKEIEKDKLPGKLEMGLVVASIVAMIGVMKYA